MTERSIPSGTIPEGRESGRAWFRQTIEEFHRQETKSVLGALARESSFDIAVDQREAWIEEIQILKEALVGLSGSLLLEYSIPRMGRRIDAVALIAGVVFPIEFKVGARKFDRADLDQVWDYALDLKYFHEASRDVSIVPILVATLAPTPPAWDLHRDEDSIFRPLGANASGLGAVIRRCLEAVPESTLDCEKWEFAPYRPTPTIIEAARALYANHSVEAIARSDAAATNLHVTSRRVDELIAEAETLRRKVICFVTGVPGAGKTLVGLDVATRHQSSSALEPAVYLSGNGPLVAVLREALTRDEVVRQRAKGVRVRKGKVGESVKAFIQNVHNFRDEALLDEAPPAEHVAVFDEAQRAWNARETSSFMRRKKHRSDFNCSEPEFLISYLDRHRDWAAVVCLVGEGQEINRGEAGISAWFEALAGRFRDWEVFLSPRLLEGEYAVGELEVLRIERARIHEDESLHLAVSMRSFRAEALSTFVQAVLSCEVETARVILNDLSDRYPIVLTRNLNAAKAWVRSHARGSERFGLVASSKALRLRPHAIDIRVQVNPVHWFLNSPEDPRSSYYLEDAATEFQVQGLEVDWACVAWDGDLRSAESGWSFHDFRGDRWCRISNSDNQRYLRNAYRVLLTRARQGMAIFVPPGDSTDATRSVAFYDPTFRYLREIGIPTID